jgi:uncharacterized protein (TIGR02001 family)
MIRFLIRSAAFAGCGITAFAAAPVCAQDSQSAAGGDGGFDISATATVVSDYRFRGVSESNRDPAIQGSVDIVYHGFYAGIWSSSIARYADSNIETDLYAGFGGESGPVAYEVGALAYLYPGGNGTGDVYEGTGSLSYTFGPATGRFRINYAPDQANLAGDNLYLSVDARVGIPATPFTLLAEFGRERGSFYGRKLDWSLGAEFTRGPITAGLSYVDTDLDAVTSGLGHDVHAGVVASASIAF